MKIYMLSEKKEIVQNGGKKGFRSITYSIYITLAVFTNKTKAMKEMNKRSFYNHKKKYVIREMEVCNG